MRRIVAIIPARGGSKGIPQKNLVGFCGKPLLAWSIEQALGAQNVSSVWVSSDCEEILALAKRCGARPIVRPPELCTDTASSESAWLHAIDTIESDSLPVDLVVGMQATSPVRESADIDRAVSDFYEGGCDSLFSASVLEDYCIWSRDKNGESLKSVNFDYKNRKRRQDATHEELVENGSLYLFKPELLREKGNRMGGKIGVSLMAFWKSFEVDSLEGLEMAQVMMRHYLLKGAVPTRTAWEKEP